VAVLKLLAPELALVSRQSETVSSFDQAQQRILLDRFGGLSTRPWPRLMHAGRQASAKLDELLQGEQDRLRMVDLWSYQSKEIEQAHLTAAEDEALETEKRVLANAEKLYAAAMGAFDQTVRGRRFGGGRAAGRRCATWRSWPVTTAALPMPRSNFSRPGLRWRRGLPVCATMPKASTASPERLTEIEDRLALLDRLKRKYGKTIAEVIAFGEEVTRKLAEVEDRDEILRCFVPLSMRRLQPIERRRRFHTERKAAAAKLAKLAESQINSLAHEGQVRGGRKREREGEGWTASAGIRWNTASPPTPASLSSRWTRLHQAAR